MSAQMDAQEEKEREQENPSVLGEQLQKKVSENTELSIKVAIAPTQNAENDDLGQQLHLFSERCSGSPNTKGEEQVLIQMEQEPYIKVTPQTDELMKEIADLRAVLEVKVQVDTLSIAAQQQMIEKLQKELEDNKKTIETQEKQIKTVTHSNELLQKTNVGLQHEQNELRKSHFS